MEEKKSLNNHEYGRKMNGYILFFGYIFYRINTLYSRVTKLAEDYQPMAIISLMQTFLLYNTFMIVHTSMFVDLEHYRTPEWVKGSFIVFYLGMCIVNTRLLIKRHWRFHLMWKDEPKKQRRLRGWLIFISILFMLSVVPVYLAIFGR